MKTRLSISQRLVLSGMLIDEENTFDTLKLLRKVKEELSLSEAEIKAVGYTSEPLPNGRFASKWLHPENDPNKEIDFGEIVYHLIKRKLYKLDHEAQLKENQLDLYDIFVKQEEKNG